MSISRGWKPVYYLLRIDAKLEFVLLFSIRGLVLERQIVVQSDREKLSMHLLVQSV